MKSLSTLLTLIPLSMTAPTTPIQSTEPKEPFYLFGASKPWHAPHWRTTDDRLRGGSSHSHLTPSRNNTVLFHGTLDISTLGGAGFASQFSPSPSSSVPPSSPSEENESVAGKDGFWNLTAYDGIALALRDADGMTYTLILKDSTPVPSELGGVGTPRVDGRERAGVSWEVEFTPARLSSSEEEEEDDGGGDGVEGEGGGWERVFFPWREFRAKYRGREVGGLEGVRRGEVRRVGVMCRSGFGRQEGGFGVRVGWIGAVEGDSGDGGGGKVGEL